VSQPPLPDHGEEWGPAAKAFYAALAPYGEEWEDIDWANALIPTLMVDRLAKGTAQGDDVITGYVEVYEWLRQLGGLP
jgi:hypothetical protein